MAAIISVPAGRSLRRSPETKWVDPQPDKGLLEMKMEDGLMHLCECLLLHLKRADVEWALTDGVRRVEKPRYRYNGGCE